jgi:putative transposase
VDGGEALPDCETSGSVKKSRWGKLLDGINFRKDWSIAGEISSFKGASGKRILTDQGRLDIEVPRDRESSFEPRLIKKGERRFSGFDDKIIAMYARGMTVREIQGYLQEMYGVLVSPDLISQVTDAVMEEVREWQNRPLERLYPVVFFDALRQNPWWRSGEK